jgi:cell filamentation protein
MTNRYDTSENPEGQFQPGSQERVLLNKLVITDPVEMDTIELDLLDQLSIAVLDEIESDQTITVDDLCEWHRRWLGNVYPWAGEHRSVNMGKAEFQFAAAHLIHKLMTTFNSQFLTVYTPCNQMNENELIEALANIHIEYILIHPFREGNGRLSRLLANIMALQADYPLLDFSYMDKNKSDYFLAIQAGLDNDEPMKAMFKQVLHDSLQNVDDSV